MITVRKFGEQKRAHLVQRRTDLEGAGERPRFALSFLRNSSHQGNYAPRSMKRSGVRLGSKANLVGSGRTGEPVHPLAEVLNGSLGRTFRHGHNVIDGRVQRKKMPERTHQLDELAQRRAKNRF